MACRLIQRQLYLESALNDLQKRVYYIQLCTKHFLLRFDENKQVMWRHLRFMLQKLSYVLRICQDIHDALYYLLNNRISIVIDLYILVCTLQHLKTVKSKHVGAYLYANVNKYPHRSEDHLKESYHMLGIIGNNLYHFNMANQNIARQILILYTSKGTWLQCMRKLKLAQSRQRMKRMKLQWDFKRRCILKTFQQRVAQIICTKRCIQQWINYIRERNWQRDRIRKTLYTIIHQFSIPIQIHQRAEYLLARGQRKQRIRSLWRKAFQAVCMIPHLYQYWKMEKYPQLLQQKLFRLEKRHKRRKRIKFLWYMALDFAFGVAGEVLRKKRYLLNISLYSIKDNEVFMVSLRETIVRHITCLNDLVMGSNFQINNILYLQSLFDEYIHILNYFSVNEFQSFRLVNMRKMFRQADVPVKPKGVNIRIQRFFVFSLKTLRYTRFHHILYGGTQNDKRKWFNMIFLNTWLALILYVRHCAKYFNAHYAIVNLDTRDFEFIVMSLFAHDNKDNKLYKRDYIVPHEKHYHIDMRLNFDEPTYEQSFFHYQLHYKIDEFAGYMKYFNKLLNDILMQLMKLEMVQHIRGLNPHICNLTMAFDEKYDSFDRKIVSNREFFAQKDIEPSSMMERIFYPIQAEVKHATAILYEIMNARYNKTEEKNSNQNNNNNNKIKTKVSKKQKKKQKRRKRRKRVK